MGTVLLGTLKTALLSYLNALIPQQLAEAILSEDASEEASSILLNDSRTRLHSTDEPERQFLVGQDEDDYEEVRSMSSTASIDTAEDDIDHERPRSGLGLMSNEVARMSHLDVHTGDIEDDVVGTRRGGGLAAKAGIILVSFGKISISCVRH